MKLKDKVALITGAGSGIGREIALRFAREGCTVGINDVRPDAAEAVAAEVRAIGGSASALPCNVADSRAVRAMFAKHVDDIQNLDILVNNAGIALMEDRVKWNCEAILRQVATTGRTTRSVEATKTMTDRHWRRTLAVHLNGTFHCTREALKIMEVNGRGIIINMASVASFTGIPGMPDYSAAKAGVVGFTKSVAREVIGRGIRVNAIAPGYIDSPLLDDMTDLMREMIMTQTPAGRSGTPAEVAATALFLASDDSSFFVGQVLAPNGGIYM